MRRLVAPFVALCAAAPLHAQVVIEERVEVKPLPADSAVVGSTSRLSTGETEEANRTWSSRAWRVFMAQGESQNVTLSGAVTVTTTEGRVYTFDASAIPTGPAAPFRCSEPSSEPPLSERYPIVFPDVEVLRIPLDFGEDVLRVEFEGDCEGDCTSTPPSPGPMPPVPPIDVGSTGPLPYPASFSFSRFYPRDVCYSYTSIGYCPCTDSGTIPRKVVSLGSSLYRAEGDRLEVDAVPDTVGFSASGSSWARIDVQATYADGVPAPSLLPYTFSVGSAQYGSLALYYCNYGCTLQSRGSTVVATSARHQVRFVADGGGGSPAPEGLWCDTPVEVTVSAENGASGTGQVVVRGTNMTPDRLKLTATPPAVGAHEESQLAAEATNGYDCDIDLPSSELYSFSIGDNHFGDLEYEADIGTTIVDVPASAAESGEVIYGRNGRKPYYDYPVEVAVAGGALSGAGEVTVTGTEEIEPCHTGNPMLDDPQVQEMLRELWKAATLNEYNELVRNPLDRREYCGYIVPQAGGGHILYRYTNPISYPDETHSSVSANCPYPNVGLTPDAIMVHPHPFYFGDATPRGTHDRSHVTASDPEDYAALVERGLSKGLVIESRGMIFFDLNRNTYAPIPRCGY